MNLINQNFLYFTRKNKSRNTFLTVNVKKRILSFKINSSSLKTKERFERNYKHNIISILLLSLKFNGNVLKEYFCQYDLIYIPKCIFFSVEKTHNHIKNPDSFIKESY
jgi:hypothetical protein